MINISGVVEFLSKGAISKEHPDLKEFRQDPCVTRFSSSDDPTVYTHGLRLDCAVDPNSMPFTNYTLVLNKKYLYKTVVYKTHVHVKKIFFDLESNRQQQRK